MSPEGCSALLAEVAPGRVASEPRELPGGWSFHTFLCDGLVVRVPRTPEDAALLVREFRLVPHLAEMLPVPIPHYTITDAAMPPRLGVYPYLRGVPLTPDRLGTGDHLATQLGAFLGALHATPAGLVTDLLGDTPQTAWGEFAAFIDTVRTTAFPLLPHRSRAVALSEIDRLLPALRRSYASAVPVHRDLGLVHVLREGDDLTGVIDWSDAGLDDPARDFVGILASGGWPAVAAVLASYGTPPGEAFRDRIAFFTWVAPLFDIFYGLRTSDAAIVEDGVAGVVDRLAALTPI